VKPAPEGAPAKLLYLSEVLPADMRGVEDEDVVEVSVRVVEGEIGRTREECRSRTRLAGVVTQDEFLVEDLRIEVAAGFDPVSEQGSEDAAVSRQRRLPLEVELVASPLDAVKGLGGSLARLRCRGFGGGLEFASQVVLLQKDLDCDTAPASVENRFRDRHRIDLLHGDVKRLPRLRDEIDDDGLEVVRRLQLLGP
jgi:hypothetical protein